MSSIFSIQKTAFKVADFIAWYKREALVLSPNFQRRSVWKIGAKSFLIDTIYKNFPIPIIFLRDNGYLKSTYEPIREVIDGQQRLRTIIAYIDPTLLKDYDPKKDKFQVKRTHNNELAGIDFKDLNDEQKAQILGYEFSVHIIPANVSDRDIIQIFRRMNSTNYTLNSIELLNAEYYGEFKTSVFTLSAEYLNAWRKWGTFNENDISRMSEAEMTSEIYTGILAKKIQGKSASRIKNDFLKYDETFQERTIVEERFSHIMNVIDNRFGSNKEDFVFFKKTLFYTFFLSVYHLLYNLNSSLEAVVEPRALTTEKVNELQLKSDRIRIRNADNAVLEATDRRTTNPKERGLLFNYLTQ